MGGEQSLMKQLQNISTILKNYFKEHETDRINYYRFVLDPTGYGESNSDKTQYTGFARSVENIFYVSFLVKDGKVKLVVDEETGLPDIGKYTNEEFYLKIDLSTKLAPR